MSRMPDRPGMATAVYSSDPTFSRGRRHPEPPPVFGDAYDEDRDRIVHSSAFRRLVYKTQVFANHEGDLFRTRLTLEIHIKPLTHFCLRWGLIQ